MPEWTQRNLRYGKVASFKPLTLFSHTYVQILYNCRQFLCSLPSVCVAKSTLRVIASNGNVTKSDNLFQEQATKFFANKQKTKNRLVVAVFCCFVICCFVICCFVVIVLYLLLCFLLFCNLMFRILLFCNLLFCFFVVAVIYCFVLFQWKNPIIQSNRQQSFIKIQLVFACVVLKSVECCCLLINLLLKDIAY